MLAPQRFLVDFAHFSQARKSLQKVGQCKTFEHSVGWGFKRLELARSALTGQIGYGIGG
jgi:hypothetical protein